MIKVVILDVIEVDWQESPVLEVRNFEEWESLEEALEFYNDARYSKVEIRVVN